jgi:hypothetical protein
MFGQRGGTQAGQAQQPGGLPVPVCPAHRDTTGTVRDTRCPGPCPASRWVSRLGDHFGPERDT